MDKILAGYVDNFAAEQGLESMAVQEQFHHFVNYCVVSHSTTYSFDIEDVSVEGQGDLGIDGVAIFADGHIVFSAEEIDFFRDKLGRLNIEFVFIQSKSSERFNAGQIGTFLHGVKSFFGEELNVSANDDICAWRDLRDYLYKLSIHMDAAPRCSMYYACTGEWHDDPTLTARVSDERRDLENTKLFSQVTFTPLDAERLKALYRTLQHKVVCEIAFDKEKVSG